MIGILTSTAKAVMFFVLFFNVICFFVTGFHVTQTAFKLAYKAEDDLGCLICLYIPSAGIRVVCRHPGLVVSMLSEAWELAQLVKCMPSKH